jgi:ATP-dependent Zn protease
MMSDQTNQDEETAFHEAGHAVLGCLVQRPPLWVSIVPDEKGNVGRTEFEQDIPQDGYRYLDESDGKKRYIRNRVLIEVAGTIAHNIKFPGRDFDEGDANDDYWATQLVSENVSWDDDREAYLSRARHDAATLLNENWNLVEKVAAALLQHRRLERADLLKVCNS